MDRELIIIIKLHERWLGEVNVVKFSERCLKEMIVFKKPRGFKWVLYNWHPSWHSFKALWDFHKVV
jgi:hypothetical protein